MTVRTGQLRSDVLNDLDALGAVAADSEFLVGSGPGVFVYESGDTARTSLGVGTGDSPTWTAAALSGAGTVLDITDATTAGMWIEFAGGGVDTGLGAPAFTTRSAGTKVVLYDRIDGTNVDYAVGIESPGALWHSVRQFNSGLSFKWYGGETQIMQLLGDASELVLGDGNTANPRRINFQQVTGGGDPTFTTYSIGTKVLLFDNINASNAGYAIGQTGGHIWFGTGQNSSAQAFDFFGGVTRTATLYQVGDGLEMLETSALTTGTSAGYGRLWVRDDVPNTAMFTDDAGTAWELAKEGDSVSFTQVFAGSTGADALEVNSGNNFDTNSQIVFAWDGGGGASFRHRVSTRHNSGVATGNAIKFYLWEAGVDASGDPGSLEVMSIVGDGTILAAGAFLGGQAGNAEAFRVGNDGSFWDINLADTIGVRGITDATRAQFRMGSSGTYLMGNEVGLHIGGTTGVEATVARLEVDGDIALLSDGDKLSFFNGGVEEGYIDTSSTALRLYADVDVEFYPGNAFQGALASGGGLKLVEMASGPSSVAARGFVWVQNNAPNNLKFLDDTDKLFHTAGQIEILSDPGDAATITVTTSSRIYFTTGASGETNTLADPTEAGHELFLGLDTDGGGNRVVTADSIINGNGDTIMTFSTPGDGVLLRSIMVKATGADSYHWLIVSNFGPALS